MTDSNGKFIRSGQWLRESWCTHGFGGGDFLRDVREFVNPNRNVRFFTYSRGMTLDSLRVNRMGWPVSGYRVEVTTAKRVREEMARLEWDEYYQYYRERSTAQA